MIFEINYGSTDDFTYRKITTNIKKVYEVYDEAVLIAKGVPNNYSKIWILLIDEDTGDVVNSYTGKLPEQTNADFVRWLADYAKKDKSINTINWVTNAISKYDNSNPTIKSLIYSLWEKAERGKDLTE